MKMLAAFLVIMAITASMADFFFSPHRYVEVSLQKKLQ